MNIFLSQNSVYCKNNVNEVIDKLAIKIISKHKTIHPYPQKTLQEEDQKQYCCPSFSNTGIFSNYHLMDIFHRDQTDRERYI